MAGRAVTQEKVLAWLAEGGCRTLAETAATFDHRPNIAGQTLAKLIQRGYVERAERGCYRATTAGIAFSATGERISSGARGPRATSRPARQTFQDRIWNALRIRRKASVEELVEIAGRPEQRQAHAALHASKFVAALLRADVLRVLPMRSATRARRYELARDLGPLSPIVSLKRAALKDRNTGDWLALGPAAGGHGKLTRAPEARP